VGLRRPHPEGGRDPMAVPKRKHSNSRTGKRRSQDAKRPPQLEYCDQCSTAVPSHTVCPKCGHYMGRKVMDTES
jgi:large subunit ribosomal protein L32